MIFIIIFIKLLFFLPSYWLYNAAQGQLDIVLHMEARNEIIVHYNFSAEDQNRGLPEILVRFPETWRPGEEREIYYEILSWDHPTQDVTLIFSTIPELGNLNSPVIFSPNMKKTISKKVTLPINQPYTGWTSFIVNGQFQLGNYHKDIDPKTIYIVDQSTLGIHQQAYTTDWILFLDNLSDSNFDFYFGVVKTVGFLLLDRR